jgi:predicted DNA-binding transcriptional regulator YafY
MRASRLLSTLLLLQTRGRMTAQELADELEVSVRTVYRDVLSLGAAGVPVYADRGPTGGYQLLDGYRTRLTGLSGDEAESLFLAGIPGPAAELGLGTVLAAAQLKLLAALPPELRTRAGRIRERFHLDAPGWFRGDDQVPHLAAVAEAAWNQHPIWVRYQRAGSAGERTRTLEPLGVVLKAGVWYLVARAVDLPARVDQILTYRIARILELEMRHEQHFERPADFDLVEFWHSWSEWYESNVYRAEAVLRLTPRGLQLLHYLMGPAVSRAATASVSLPDADGWVQVVLPIESVEHALAECLRLGTEAEVLSPPELRDRLRETATALANLYRPE